MKHSSRTAVVIFILKNVNVSDIRVPPIVGSQLVDMALAQITFYLETNVFWNCKMKHMKISQISLFIVATFVPTHS